MTGLSGFAQGGVFALAHQYKDRGGMGASLTQEQKDRLEWLWLVPNKPSVKMVVKILEDSFQMVVGEKTAGRYLNAIPKAVADCHRKSKQLPGAGTERGCVAGIREAIRNTY
jgi:hypothetical protein